MIGQSPRVATPASRRDIETALRGIGHVVIERLWPLDYLGALRQAVADHFAALDAAYAENPSSFSNAETEVYLGNVTALDSLRHYEQRDRAFFDAISSTGLPALYRRLFTGDFVISRGERALRRADPRFPLRFHGLHVDGQLGPLSREGIRTKRELTLWTPLVDCIDEDTPRMLYLHRGETFSDLLTETDFIEDRSVRYSPIQLRPFQFRDETARSELSPKIEELFTKILEKRRCYTPHIPLGGAILFDKDIIHATYMRPGMKKPRYSLDFRAVGEYRVTTINGGYSGRLFRSKMFGLGQKWHDYPAQRE
jgi:hypothetical protein